MISAGDFRNGVTFEYDNSVFQVVEFLHVKPGKGAAFVRTKLRNVINGGVVERTFNPTDKVQEAKIDRKSKQYLYKDDDFYNFMDPETYEQDQIAIGDIEDAMKWLQLEYFLSLGIKSPNVLNDLIQGLSVNDNE
jgi:elongation factor P